MSEELKPCPFCGGKARMHVAFASGGDHSVGVYVECPECRSQSGTKWDDGAQEKAAEGWNRRAERTCRMEYNKEWSGDELYPTECYNCSECRYMTCDGMPSYCPNCGAKVVVDD